MYAKMKANMFILPLVVALLITTLCADVHSVTCSNPPPGVRKMVRGVDITELDLTPLSVTGPSGFKSPVIKFTCSENREWTSPRGGSYQLPDQIWHITSMPGGWLPADIKLYKNYNEVRQSMADAVGIDGSIWKFSFSNSYSFRKMQTSITNSSCYISDVSAFDSATQVDFNPPWILEMDDFVKMFADSELNGTYYSNPAAYNLFIEHFGTHYFSSAKFGGYIRVLHETPTSYFSSKSDAEVKAEAKNALYNFIFAKGGQIENSPKVSKQFASKSIQSVSYFGGYTNLLAEDGIQKWQPTVYTDPWLFAGQMRPISDLISDPVKRDSMILAVAHHVIRAYLEELQSLIEIRSWSQCEVDQTRISFLRGLRTSMGTGSRRNNRTLLSRTSVGTGSRRNNRTLLSRTSMGTGSRRNNRTLLSRTSMGTGSRRSNRTLLSRTLMGTGSRRNNRTLLSRTSMGTGSRRNNRSMFRQRAAKSESSHVTYRRNAANSSNKQYIELQQSLQQRIVYMKKSMVITESEATTLSADVNCYLTMVDNCGSVNMEQTTHGSNVNYCGQSSVHA